MLTRRIGSLDVSVVGVGCNNFGWTIFTHFLDEAATAKVVHAALDAGVNFFDTAESYGDSETLLGSALKGRRERAIIATKCSKGSPASITASLDASLRRLNTDRIDLYQLHRPDPDVPVAETVGALQELVRLGKVREIGCSNFSVDQLRAADKAAGESPHFASVQNELSLINRAAAKDVVPECERLSIAFLPFFPLANGLLTGKYRLGKAKPPDTRLASGPMSGRLTEAALATAERLAVYAESRRHTLLELAFAWLLASTAVASVIAGVTSVEQVRANATAAAWQLTPEERSAVSALVDA
jgi:aryl-alcohol dehydrogenase-like predicted oxidoreductase